MAHYLYGYTYDDIVSMVMDYIGNSDSDFKAYLQQKLVQVEMNFCSRHDWKFLRQYAGFYTNTYKITTIYTYSGVTRFMPTGEITKIINMTTKKELKKITLDELLELDPARNSGTSNSDVTHWCPYTELEIYLYPFYHATQYTVIYGRTLPVMNPTFTNYLFVPARYQDVIIAFLEAHALDRENDDRAIGKFQMAELMLQKAIEQDEDIDNYPRLKMWWEDPNYVNE